MTDAEKITADTQENPTGPATESPSVDSSRAGIGMTFVIESARAFTCYIGEAERKELKAVLQANGEKQGQTLDEVAEDMEIRIDPYTITGVKKTSESVTIKVSRDLPENHDLLFVYIFYVWLLKGFKATKNSTKAKQSGAIMTPGTNIITITDKDYQNAFSIKKNKFAYVIPLEAGSIEQLTFSPDSGILEKGELKVRTDAGLVDATLEDMELLNVFATALFRSAEPENVGLNTITVYIKSFFDALGTSTRTTPQKTEIAHRADIKEKLKRLSSYVGRIGYTNPGTGQVWEVFRVIGEDYDTGMVTIACPYLTRVFYKVKEKNTNPKPTKALPYKTRPYLSALIHSDIISERNKTAVEIVTRLIAGLQQRGGTPDAKLSKGKNRTYKDTKTVTYRVQFATIVDNIPILKNRLDQAKTASVKNTILKRAFSKAYELLETKTDAYKYYIHLNKPSTIPTSSTLKTDLTLQHEGINGSYEKQLSLFD